MAVFIQINLFNINDVWPTTSEELHLQSEEGRTSKHTERLYAPYYPIYMYDIKINWTAI